MSDSPRVTEEATTHPDDADRPKSPSAEPLDLDELRADIKRQQDAAQRQAEEAKARIEGRERRAAALARRGTVVSLSEQSARVVPEEGAAEAKGDT